MDTNKNYCFCELAPFYALDVLSEEEKIWVEEQIADCPDLSEELATYQLAVEAIPYSIPDLPMSDNLKDRLFERLELEVPPAETVSEVTPVNHLGMRASELNWQPHPLASGVTIAIVHRDEIKREIVGFLKAEAGVRYPLHLHRGIEELFMLEGDLIVDDLVYGAGDYIRSEIASSHAPYTIGGCKFFFHSSMDDEYPELVICH
jgi:ChrR Cupin-like domain